MISCPFILTFAFCTLHFAFIRLRALEPSWLNFVSSSLFPSSTKKKLTTGCHYRYYHLPMPDITLLRDKILKLKKDLNAVILAHNYQRAEVQDIADITGDSLELSRAAAKTDYRVIVFCGVHFMAESASILSPDKTVLLPE